MKLTGKNLSKMLACAVIAGMTTAGTAGYLPAGFQTTEICAVDASASDEFISAAVTESSEVSVYNDGTKSFFMNGRKYCQGVILGSGIYSKAEITFDVSGKNTFSFDIAHIDNSDDVTAEIEIFLDDVSDQIIQISKNSIIKRYTIDVSKASSLKIVKSSNNGRFGLADIAVDEVETAYPYTVPEYKTAGSFIISGYDKKDIAEYSGDNAAKSFKMNGRSYYQGIVFGLGFFETPTISLNVENVKTISFSIGNVDNVDNNYNYDSVEFTIFKDNVEEDEKITATSNGLIKEYTIDVSDTKVLRIERSYSGGVFAMADITVDECKPAIVHKVPGYKQLSSFINSAYNSYRIAKYDGTDKARSIKIGGRTYYDGILLNTPQLNYDSGLEFNVENLKTVSFTVGHVDNTESDNVVLYVYKDNTLEDEITVDCNYPAQKYTVDVSDAHILRIARSESFSETALTDFDIDGIVAENKCLIPDYKSPSAFISSAYDKNSITLYNDESKTFKMNDKEFTDGFVFTGSGSVSFNTEKLSSLTFTLGAINVDTADEPPVLTIYGDGEEKEEIRIAADMTPEKMTVDVSKYNNVRFSFEGYFDSCGIGNMSFVKTSDTPAAPVTTPAVTTAKPVSGTTPAVTTAKPVSGTTPAVTTAKPVSGTTPAVTTAKPVSGITPAVTTAKPDPSAPVKGDFNGDGTVTTTDVRAILKHIVGSEVLADEKAADFDGDGEVTTSDALRLLRFVIGEIDSL